MYYSPQLPWSGMVATHFLCFAAARVHSQRRFHVKRSIGFLAICVLLLGVSLKAQAPAMPKPGPEQKRLAYFVGNWTEKGKSTMPGMVGDVSSTQKWEWMSGGFFLEAHMDMTSTMGKAKALGVMGYDPDSKMYTYNEFDSNGGAITAKGKPDGDTWNWTSDMMMEGKPMKTRVTIKEVSKTEYTFKMESSMDNGKTWTTGMESTLTKVVASAPAATPKKN
jgi:hypothetical protein